MAVCERERKRENERAKESEKERERERRGERERECASLGHVAQSLTAGTSSGKSFTRLWAMKTTARMLTIASRIILPNKLRRASAVKVVPKRLPVFPFSGFDLYHHFRNDAFHGLYNLLKVQKTGKREVILGQPLPQTL